MVPGGRPLASSSPIGRGAPPFYHSLSLGVQCWPLSAPSPFSGPHSALRQGQGWHQGVGIEQTREGDQGNFLDGGDVAVPPSMVWATDTKGSTETLLSLFSCTQAKLFPHLSLGEEILKMREGMGNLIFRMLEDLQVWVWGLTSLSTTEGKSMSGMTKQMSLNVSV